MKDLRSIYGNTAMVIGAAEGLGAAFATQLALRGFTLVLVDIKEDTLQLLAKNLHDTYFIEVHCVVTDLNQPASADQLHTEWKELGCGFLVYNAAYGPVKTFLSNNSDELDRYINVNTRTTTHLVSRILHSSQGKPTGILLLSSLAGFRGTQFVVPYAATKAYLWNFVEGCHYEFRGTAYDFGICCPGATATPNYLATKPRKTAFSPSPQTPDKVAMYALNNFGKRLFLIPGFSNRLVYFIFTRLLPRKWASRLHNDTMERMYSN